MYICIYTYIISYTLTYEYIYIYIYIHLYIRTYLHTYVLVGKTNFLQNSEHVCNYFCCTPCTGQQTASAFLRYQVLWLAWTSCWCNFCTMARASLDLRSRLHTNMWPGAVHEEDAPVEAWHVICCCQAVSLRVVAPTWGTWVLLDVSFHSGVFVIQQRASAGHTRFAMVLDEEGLFHS